MPNEDPADHLYSLPLEEFTAARNELVKRLRAEGDRESAAEVAKLRKPSRPAWAINRAARSDPALPEALLDSAAALAEAQEAVVSGSGRELLDAAVRAEREAVEDLVAAVRVELDAAGSASEAMVDRARRTLHAVAGDPELQAELAAARISRDREPVGFGATPVAPAARRAKRTAPAAPEPAAGGDEAEAGAAQARAAERGRLLTEARRRADQARRRLAKRERDLMRSRARLEEARKGLARAEEEVAELAEDLQRRRKELEDAEAVVAELS